MFENLQVPTELIPSDPRFGCGPSLIPIEYVTKLAEAGPHLLGTSHRKSAVKKIQKEAQDGLKKYFSLKDETIALVANGGATMLFDMIALGAVENKVVHFTCGEFSLKWAKSSQMVPWIETEIINVEMGQGISPYNVEDADVICCTLNETSTGVQIDKLPKVNDDQLLIVDATSGAGQLDFDFNQADIVFFSAQKVFASEGGTHIVILSKKAQDKVLNISKTERYIPAYMNWATLIENGVKNQVYNTPSISALFFLNEQVKEMNKCGFKGAVELANKKANLLYGWANEKDYLKPYIEDEKFRSKAVACIDVNDKINVEDLLEQLEKQKIVYGIDSYRKLGRNQFRISLFHNIKFEDLKKLTELLSWAIEKELK
ncbi:MAG: phosphoserine transaminase [Halobacteriovoraceae bacterium]|nr:phosphoserine transaminase [Halobacteriovoraceae bacterium]